MVRLFARLTGLFLAPAVTYALVTDAPGAARRALAPLEKALEKTQPTCAEHVPSTNPFFPGPHAGPIAPRSKHPQLIS